jgi:hypothetical protein
MAIDRSLPTAALPRTDGQPRVRPAREAVARPAVARRSEAFLTTPARAGILLGASAAVYAVTLGGVAVLQANDDAALAAQRRPALDAIAASRAANDALESGIATQTVRAQAAADRYGELSTAVDAFETRLDQLAALVVQVQGSAASLPTRIHLPSAAIQGAIAAPRVLRAPKTTTTTRASGGG